MNNGKEENKMKKEFIVVMFLVLSSTACSSDTGQAAQTIEMNRTVELPEGRAGLSGTVKTIYGNEVTLEVREMPQIDGEQRQNIQDMSEEERRAYMQQMREKMQEEVRTEKQTLLIPVGVPIFSLESEDKEPLELSDIKSGCTLQLWKEEDQIIAVGVLPAGSIPRGGGFGGGPGGGFGGGMGGPPM